MTESRSVATDRLRCEGRWEEASLYRDEMRRKFKAEGLKCAEANEASWDAMLAKYPPQAVPEPDHRRAGAERQSAEAIERFWRVADAPATICRGRQLGLLAVGRQNGTRWMRRDSAPGVSGTGRGTIAVASSNGCCPRRWRSGRSATRRRPASTGARADRAVESRARGHAPQSRSTACPIARDAAVGGGVGTNETNGGILGASVWLAGGLRSPEVRASGRACAADAGACGEVRGSGAARRA